MGKKTSAKTGGAYQLPPKQIEKIMKNNKNKNTKHKEVIEYDSEIDEEDEDLNYLSFDKIKKFADDDDNGDDEVFNLALDEDDDNDDEEEYDDEEDDDDEEEDEEDDDDSYDDDDDNDLNNLIKNLPNNIKQKVLQKKKKSKELSTNDDNDDDNDEEEIDVNDWGRKKKTYWSGDTADLEIGQELQDAEDEEDAVMELHQQKLKRMKESDFYDDYGNNNNNNDDDDDDDDDGDNNLESLLNNKKNNKSKLPSKKTTASDSSYIGDLIGVSPQKSEKTTSTKTKLSGSSHSSHEEDHIEDNHIQIEHLSKDISKLTKEQRLNLINRQSPEFLGIVSELKEAIDVLKNRIEPIKELITKLSSDIHQVDDDIVEYLEVKQQMLLSYCMNILFYIYLKAQGKSVKNHPVMKQLLKLRYAIEKMRSLDSRLQHQIDRLVQLSELNTNELMNQQNSELLRPNPNSLLINNKIASKTKSNKNNTSISSNDKNMKGSKHSTTTTHMNQDSDEDGYNEHKYANDDYYESDIDGDEKDNVGVYKVPKRNAVPYKESETELDRKEQKLEKHRQKLKRSELMETLRAEFGSTPEVAASSGLGIKSGDLQKLQEEEIERQEFEEDRFVRMTLTRKEKKSIKKRTAEATRLDNFDDIGDVGDFEEIAQLSAGRNKSNDLDETQDDNDLSQSNINTNKLRSNNKISTALQRAVMALSQQTGDDNRNKSNKKNYTEEEDVKNDEDDRRFENILSVDDRKRRRAPDFDMNDDDDDERFDNHDHINDDDNGSDNEDNLLEDFSQKKKDFLAKKKAHYTAEPQYGGYEDVIKDGNKRAASYEIIKNRGLTPHRKKANRNPRVKKREMYDKAIIRRKGQVRDVITGNAGAYGGEMTGIKANIARSRKMET